MKTFKLMPLELRRRDLLPEHYRCIKIGNHFLSIRKKRGCPFPTNDKEETLYIHRLDKGGTTRRLKPDMKPGDTYTGDKFTVNYVSYDDEVATVEVKV